MSRVVRVEEGDDEVDEHSQVEGDAAPEGHVPGAPVEDGLGCMRHTQVNVLQPS